MLFPSQEKRRRTSEIAHQLLNKVIDDAEAGRQILEAYPESGLGYLPAGAARAAAGDLAGAESLYWKGLERNPCGYSFYLALSDTLRKDDPEGELVMPLRMLGIWKLALGSEIPDTVADSFRGKSDTLNFNDPETYEMLATAYEIQHQKHEEEDEEEEALAEPDRLLPYQLLNDLQRQAPSVVAYQLVDKILANSVTCLPIWRSALRDWARREEALSTEAVCLVLALLGEMAGIDALDDLLEVAIFNNDQIFLHANWAIWRMGQRFPDEVLEKLRVAGLSAPPPRRCAIAEQMDLLPDLVELAAALLGLLEGFDTFADHSDAHYLLMVVYYALDELGLEGEARQILDHFQPMLPPAGKKSLRALLDRSEDFTTKLRENEIDALSIHDICIDRELFPSRERGRGSGRLGRRPGCGRGRGRACSAADCTGKAWAKRPVLVRKREEIQEVPSCRG